MTWAWLYPCWGRGDTLRGMNEFVRVYGALIDAYRPLFEMARVYRPLFEATRVNYVWSSRLRDC